MRTQLKDLSELVGRAIEGAHQAGDEVVLTLSGNAFVYLSVEHGYEGDTEVTTGDTFELENRPTAAVECGICTEEEAKAATDARDRRLTGWQEDRDMAEYERLRAKFEGKGQ